MLAAATLTGERCRFLNVPEIEDVRVMADVLRDLGVVVDGYYGDSAMTVPVGKVSEGAQRLLRVTEESLERGIEKARVGNRVGDISAAVQEHVEKNGFSIVRDMVGHGIGRDYHQEPQVPNFGQAGHGPALKLRLAAPAVEGRATRACVEFLAAAAGVPRGADRSSPLWKSARCVNGDRRGPNGEVSTN